MLFRTPKLYTLIISVLVAVLVTALSYYLDFQSFSKKDSYLKPLLIFSITLILVFGIAYFFFITILHKKFNEFYKQLGLVNHVKKPINIEAKLKILKRQINREIQKNEITLVQFEERESYRREFLGNVAHELRTPLFTSQSFIHTLLDNPKVSSAKRKDYLDRVLKSIERIIFIVEDLSLINQLEAGVLDVKTTVFNIVSLIKDVVELVETNLENKGTNIELDYPKSKIILVKADNTKIEQVLTNLVVNATNYGKENGTIKISLEENKKGKVYVVVSDDGDGIPEEYQEKIFQRFYRIDSSRSRETGGSGLGLSIVKHILEAHGEMISLESKVGEGSTFKFSLSKA